nr:VOC family protein [uncultured Actinoplanes sp.]
MTAFFAQCTFDVHDLTAMSEFWSAALGYEVAPVDEKSVRLRPPLGTEPSKLTVLLQVADTPHRHKNRVHMDLGAEDVDAEVERLIGLGARHADVGQGGGNPFVVLMDPEDNEFCVLNGDPRRD